MNIRATVLRTLRTRFAYATLVVAVLPVAPALSVQRGSDMKIAVKARAVVVQS